MFREALERAETLRMERSIPYLLANLGECLFELGHTDDAVINLQKALRSVKEQDNAALKVALLAELGRVEGARGNRDRSRQCFEESLTTGQRLAEASLLLHTLTRLAERVIHDDPRRVRSWLQGVAHHPSADYRDKKQAESLLHYVLEGDASLPAKVSAVDGLVQDALKYLQQ